MHTGVLNLGHVVAIGRNGYLLVGRAVDDDKVGHVTVPPHALLVVRVQSEVRVGGRGSYEGGVFGDTGARGDQRLRRTRFRVEKLQAAFGIFPLNFFGRDPGAVEGSRRVGLVDDVPESDLAERLCLAVSPIGGGKNDRRDDGASNGDRTEQSQLK